MQNIGIISTPVHFSHSHFFNYIEEFPGLPEGQSHETTQARITRSLKNQYLTGQPKQAIIYLRARECLSFPDKFDVEFCLKNKLPGVSVQQAGSILGINKNKKSHH